MGYRVKSPENLFMRRGYLAGSDSDRASQLMRLFEDESVRAVFCARGGFGSMKLLPLLDFETICAQPKIFMGFSDITALLVAMYNRCGMATFHGPLVTTLKKDSRKTCTALINAVGSNRPLALEPHKAVVLNPGQASGRLVGGNLASLCQLVGTPCEPRFKDHLLFLEDRGEAPYRIDRMLSQLRLGGRLDGVAGVVLGSFQDCGPLEDLYPIVKEAFRHTGAPILAGFDIGHGTDNLTVPIGLEADLDTEDGSLRFQEPATHEDKP
jgi:muramoyltetrapeptide carboxypeptidase